MIQWHYSLNGHKYHLSASYEVKLHLYINGYDKIYQESFSILQLKTKSGMDDIDLAIKHMKENLPDIDSSDKKQLILTWEPFLPFLLPYDKTATKTKKHMNQEYETQEKVRYQVILFSANQKIEQLEQQICNIAYSKNQELPKNGRRT
jgi:hypothetical protein